MEDFLSIFIITSFCFIISFYEYKIHHTYLTPFNIMMYPYIMIVLSVNTFGKHFGFFPINIKSVLFVVVCALFFKFGAWIFENNYFAKNYVDKSIHYTKDELELFFNRYLKIFIICAIISIIASIIHFKNALAEVGGWVYLASKEFEDAYGKGLLSHIGQLNRPAFTFLFAYYIHKRNKYIAILLTLMFLSVLVLQIKTHIITVLLSGVIFSCLVGVLTINFKKLFYYAIVIFALFNLSYVIGFSKIGIENAYSSKVQIYLFNLFFTYLFGGVIGLSEVINDYSYPIFSYKEIFAIPINLYNAIHSNPELVDVIVHKWIPVSTNYHYFHYTNVYTFFGMLYMYIGRYWSYLYMFITGLISYLIKNLAFKKFGYIGYKLTYAFYLSFLATSFFDIFFNQLQIYHTTVLMLLIPHVSDSLKKINKMK